MSKLKHLSYSAVTKYLSNPYEFNRVYLERKYRDDTSPAAAVGKAMHKAIEMFYKGSQLDAALKGGEAELFKQEAQIRFTENQCMEDSVAEYRALVAIYFNAPVFNPANVVSIEEQIVADVEGVNVKLKAVSDLLGRATNGDLVILDWKKVSRYTNPMVVVGYDDQGAPIKVEMIPAKYLIQAYFNYQTVRTKYKEIPKSMIFVEIKASMNRDKSPQIRQYHIDLTNEAVLKDFDRITKLVNHIASEVEHRTSWLPNFDDMFVGDLVWHEWLNEEAVPQG